MANCKQCGTRFVDSIPQHGKKRLVDGTQVETTYYITPDICRTCQGIKDENKRRKFLTDRHNLVDNLSTLIMKPAQYDAVCDHNHLQIMRNHAKMGGQLALIQRGVRI